MDYAQLVEAIHRYSRTDDLCLSGLGLPGGCIREDVIITPGWPPERVAGLGEARLLVASGPLYGLSVWEVETEGGQALTYIKTGCGAPAVLDTLLSLGETGCKRILFLSSIGALSPEMAIGDLVLPEWSMSGDGASRFLAEGLADTWGEKSFPDAALFARLKEEAQKVCGREKLGWHVGHPFCTDTFLAQFPHISDILARGCDCLDMENAVAFRAAALMGIPIAALQCVSDNSVAKKSLLGGATEEEQAHRHFVRKKIIPEIIKNLFQ